MPKKDIKINIQDDNESSDDEVQRVVKPKKEPKIKEVEAEPVAVVPEPVAVPVAEPVPVVKEKKKRTFTEQGKEQILKNLEIAKLKKQLIDLNKRLENEGKTPTQAKKEEKKKQTREQLEEAIKKVMVKPEKPKKKIIYESESDSEEEVIVRRRKPQPKKKIIYEPESPPPAPKPSHHGGNLEELERILYGGRPKSYFL